jgi:hypothetical protein
VIVNPWGSPSKFHGDSDILPRTQTQDETKTQVKLQRARDPGVLEICPSLSATPTEQLL